MGRPRKPLEQHVLEGTYRQDRHGPLPVAPIADTPTKPPQKPHGLGGDAGRFWGELVALLKDVVRETDGPLLAEACRWFALCRRIDRELRKVTPADKSFPRLLRSRGVSGSQLDRLLARFGLTPADRIKLAPATLVIQPMSKVPTRPRTKLDRMGPPKKEQSDATQEVPPGV